MKPPPRKKNVIILHERLEYLLKELEPWESKLQQATKRARIRLRKEKEDYVEPVEQVSRLGVVVKLLVLVGVLILVDLIDWLRLATKFNHLYSLNKVVVSWVNPCMYEHQKPEHFEVFFTESQILLNVKWDIETISPILLDIESVSNDRPLGH